MSPGSFRYFGDQRFGFMRKLFRAWHRQLEKFETDLYDDLPYWYSERTNIGVLAAAALRLKNVVPLEEYPIRRGDKAGRADLGLYDAQNGRSYDFEFKFTYWALGWSATKRIRDAILAAKRDVKSLPKPPARSQSVAVTFVLVYLPKTQTLPIEKLDSLWKDFLHVVEEPMAFGANFVAVHRAPNEIVKLAAGKLNGFHPGVAAFGKVVPR